MAKTKMAQTGFVDPIASEIRVAKVKSPWNFKAPSYDESKMIQAGDNYGMGHRNPVGHLGKPMCEVPVLPKGRVKTMENTASKFDQTKIYEKD
jgi:hypothetical protein